MRVLLTFLALLLVPTGAFAQRNAAAAQSCYKMPSQAEARDCLQQIDAQSRREVMEAQKELFATLQQWTQEPEYRKASADALRLAIANFEQFRDAQCEYVASLSAGGNVASDRRLLCLIELNEQRARQLKAEVERLR